jgi:allene oxide cyclase-like protein
MKRFLTLVVLALTLISTQAESRSKRIHVSAVIVDQTFTGDITNPKIGDILVISVDLFDKSDNKVGTGSGACTVVSVPEHPDHENTLIQCLSSAVFDQEQIIFGGLVQLPEVGAVGQFGILGGTGKFRKARGEATLTVLSPTTQDATFDIEIDSERRHGKFAE